jgi:RimJ/RimL family protein N-acetyltransferase
MQAKASGLVSLRPLRRPRLDEDLQILRDIFNDAWAENWGFVPFTEAEFKDMGHSMARIIDEEFVQIAEVEGKPAAMIILLPNLNESIGDLNGRLLPFGWLKLFWRLKKAYPKSGRVALMGVRRQYQGSLLGTALAFLVIDALREPVMRRGMNEVEMSWILEKNRPMWRIIESLGGALYKRYRLYEKQLD